jgi:hypothetical protein
MIYHAKTSNHKKHHAPVVSEASRNAIARKTPTKISFLVACIE